MRPRKHMMFSTVSAALAVAAFAAPAPASSDLLLIRRPAEMISVQVIEITDQHLTFWREGYGDQKINLDECVALISDSARVRVTDRGMLVLADGQRLPGESLSSPKSGSNTLAWSHREFGRIEAASGIIRSVSFASHVDPPPAGSSDVLVLNNGDRVSGLVTALGDPVTLMPDGSSRSISLPMQRIASISFVSPERKGAGRRLWMTDGTVVDVAQLRLGHDGLLRLQLAGSLTSESQHTLKLSDVSAVMFDAESAIPLSSVQPTSITGPKTRYVLPAPVLRDRNAPIGLMPIELSGPVAIRYALPSSPMEMVGEVTIPPTHRTWGDLDVVILDDEREVFRARLNGEQPSAPIRIALRGSEMTIRLEEGNNGPLQDTVVLEHPLLLKSRQPETP